MLSHRRLLHLDNRGQSINGLGNISGNQLSTAGSCKGIMIISAFCLGPGGCGIIEKTETSGDFKEIRLRDREASGQIDQPAGQGGSP